MFIHWLGDQRFEGGHTLEWYNPNEQLSHTFQKGQFPVSGRDFVILKSTIRESSHRMIFLSTSVDEAHFKADNKRVRADLSLAAFVIEKVEGGAMLTYIVDVDPKGSIPSALIKLVAVQTPLCVAEVRRYLETYGVPTHFSKIHYQDPGIQLKVTKDHFDHCNREFEFTYQLTLVPGEEMTKESGLVEIYVDGRMLETGAEITPLLSEEYMQIKVAKDMHHIYIYPNIEKLIAHHVTEIVFSGKISPRNDRFGWGVSVCGEESIISDKD
jgi:hypothetical protein